MEAVLGEIRKLTCRECGAEEGYSTGVGMLYAETSIKLLQGDLATLKYEVSEAVFKQVSKLIQGESGKILFIQDQDNFCCEVCNTASHLNQLKVIGLSEGDWIETLKCVKCDADFVERKIHEAFDDVRLNESREFFTIAPEKVKAALEITGGKEVTPTEEIIETETDLLAIEKQRNKNRFNFSKIGIEAGTILEFKKKPSETCKVLDDDQVLFRDETTSLSKSALTLIQELGYNWDKIAGPQFWSYKGKTLYELSNERQ